MRVTKIKKAVLIILLALPISLFAQIDTIALSNQGISFNNIFVPNGIFDNYMVNAMSKVYLDSIMITNRTKYKRYRQGQFKIYKIKEYPIEFSYIIEFQEFYSVRVYMREPNCPVLLYNGMELLNAASTFTTVCIENPLDGTILDKTQGGGIFTGFCQAKLPNFLIGFNFEYGRARRIEYVDIYFK